MTNIQAFNERYGLSNISTNAFRPVEVRERANDLAGKPKKNILEIAKRFFKNKVAVASLIIFVVIIILSIVLSRVSIYSPNDNIRHSTGSQGASLSSFYNLPPKGTIVTEVQPVDFTKTLDKYHIHYQQINDLDSVDLAKLGRVVVRYDAWSYINSLDGFKHNSLIGTNSKGVDVWTRTWFGTAESLKLVIFVSVIATVVGTIFGSWVGLYVGTIVDILVLRFIGVFSSIPTIIWNIFILMILPPSFWAEFFMFLITGWMSSFALARQYMWKYVNSDFMKLAKTLGVSRFGRIFKHALPNYIGIIAFALVQMIPATIEAEATLGFVGFSPNPNGASLGNVLNEMSSAISGTHQNNLYIAVPVIIIAAIVFSLKFVAIGINDAVNPKYIRK